jgi:hypothetical protein
MNFDDSQSILDLEHLLASGDLELADRICQTEIDRLVSIKQDILCRQQRPLGGGNTGMCSQDSLSACIIYLKAGNLCAQLDCCMRPLGGPSTLMDYGMGLVG